MQQAKVPMIYSKERGLRDANETGGTTTDGTRRFTYSIVDLAQDSGEEMSFSHYKYSDMQQGYALKPSSLPYVIAIQEKQLKTAEKFFTND